MVGTEVSSWLVLNAFSSQVYILLYFLMLGGLSGSWNYEQLLFLPLTCFNTLRNEF
jgi:hypothetical protein